MVSIDTPKLNPNDPETIARCNTLTNALNDMKLVEGEDQRISVYDTASGVLGKSSIWFLCIPRKLGNAQFLVAKFDEPARAEAEWKAVEELRNINLSVQAILPIGNSKKEHGVIIYQSVDSLTQTGEIWHYKQFLEKQLANNPNNCLDVFTKAMTILRLFYNSEPGAARMATDTGQVRQWSVFFPAITEKANDIEAGARIASPGFNPNAALFELGGISLLNPLFYHKEILQKIAGRIMLSRIHGDLNLTNIMIGLKGNYAPDGVFIIDLANSQSEAPTALDFARLESEFWHEAFAPNAGSQCLQEMKAVRDWLDGRPPRELSPQLSPLAINSKELVNAIRLEALRILKDKQTVYCMDDYMRALYFSHIRALAFPSVQAAPIKCQAALLGAALSLQFIKDLETGKYVR